MKLGALVALLGLIPALVTAQPAVDNLSTYDFNQHESFLDIYQCQDGGYVMCGVTSEELYVAYPFHSEGDPYVVRVDSELELIWENSFDVGVAATAYTIIEAENGDFIVGVVGDPFNFPAEGGRFIAFRITPDGELIWQRDYACGGCLCVLELKAGDFILAGKWREADGQMPDDNYIIRIDSDGDVVWSRRYDFSRYEHIRSIREGDGEVVCSGYRWEGVPYPNIFKVNANNGEVVWRILFDSNNSPTGYFDGLVSSADGGFVTVGNANYLPTLLKFTSDGEILWQRIYENLNTTYSIISISRMSEGGYTLCGGRSIGVRQERPVAIRVNPDGLFRWGMELDLDQQGFSLARNRFMSSITTHDDVVLAAGEVRQDNDADYDGLVVRLGPGHLGPQIVRYTPQDTSLYVLTGDSITFTLFALGTEDYLWYRDGEHIGRDDTLCTVVFPERDQDVRIECVAFNVDASITMGWNVHVRDLFIADYTPDTLDLFIRRGSSVDFSLDTIRYTEGDRPDYLWTKTNLATGQAENPGEDAQANIWFPWSGEYSVEGRIFRAEASDAVTWLVNVRGLIWAFVPAMDSLVVVVDSIVHFEVVPNAPDDESLEVTWLVNGEFVREAELSLDWLFSEADLNRNTLVQAIARDSVETDTVQWIVNVNDLAVGGPSVAPPRSSAILAAFPNPFNSTVTIQFQSPHAIAGGVGGVSLRIYDISGRLVTDLTAADPPRSAGNHKVTWDASSVGAGVYFVRLEAGTEVKINKLILMR